ncbi:SMEK domain-containing protein [Butyrivibrio sp. INlla16]|uniref:SMEK domain-containing protein n=1 Tax=Butyrivibrio sp. INlla16 TaxID=1520807 RepID=UPI00088A1AC7|nr:SMEK domain-containing protein [Butyrivibrio sp. INlla16]SDB66056.1 hypothetical protein SAMN02910263_03791 [Butyrivibrio sp. INlla16]
MNRDFYLKNIADNLALLSKQVEVRNAISLFDINIVAEDFYAGLLNIILDTNLINENIIQKNIAGIDLVDDNNRLVIQVTSDNTSEKIQHTIDLFISGELFLKYDQLKVLILTKRKKYRTNFDTKGKFVFDKAVDIWDVCDLIDMIRPLDIDKLKCINEYLDKELYEKYAQGLHSEASEVDTIIDLIEFISAHKKVSIPKDVVIDPEFKINTRFKEFAESITTQYVDLLTVYGNALLEVENSKGDEAQDIITRIYLQDISVQFLDKSNNNPLHALDELTDFFKEKMSISGKTYDRSAIKFYLVDKMIKCSVFPNERGVYNVG